jgi:hypothetical protein
MSPARILPLSASFLVAAIGRPAWLLICLVLAAVAFNRWSRRRTPELSGAAADS